ncbi:MAG: cytochrome c oxidase subunit II [bacterium]
MQSKWTALGILASLVFIMLVPTLASTGDAASFWMWMPESITPGGAQISALFNMVLALCGILFIDIHAIMLYFIVRYPAKEEVDYEPAEPNATVEFIWAIVPTLLHFFFANLTYSFDYANPWTTLGWILFFVVHTWLLFAIIRDTEHYGEETSERHGHLGIELTWTVIPTIIMVSLGIYTFQVYESVISPPKESVEIKVTGKQFNWEIEYPGNYIAGKNSIQNTLVLPKGRAVSLHMTSEDVLHSFYVPAFHLKQDVVPGRETHIRLKNVEKKGKYRISCAELCGFGHYRMTGNVYVVNPDQYWEYINSESRTKRKEILEKVTNSD